MKQLAKLCNRDAAVSRAANIVDAFPAEKRALALVQRVEDAVQHDLGGPFLTDHQLVFKMPVGHVAQVFVAMHPHLGVFIKDTPFLFRHFAHLLC